MTKTLVLRQSAFFLFLFLTFFLNVYALYKWSGGGVPSQSMDLQEMVMDGGGQVFRKANASDLSVPRMLF
jgi:hypothetical protein